jgi:hypothetical protein
MFMAALAVIVALVALWIGYECGRRTNPTRSSWRKKTSRASLGRQAVTLMVLITARRVRRRLPAGRKIPDFVQLLWRGPPPRRLRSARHPRKPVARGGVARYRRSVT